jgi:hypothetical protein
VTTTAPTQEIAVRLRLALDSTDLELLALLLHPDVRWGDGPDPRACRSKADVLVTFARLMGDGVAGTVMDVIVPPGGVVMGHAVTWRPEQSFRSRRGSSPRSAVTTTGRKRCAIWAEMDPAAAAGWSC